MVFCKIPSLLVEVKRQNTFSSSRSVTVILCILFESNYDIRIQS